MAKREKSEAAEKVKKAAKNNKATKAKSKKDSAFARFLKSFPKFWKDFRAEVKKIIWPDSKTVLKSTGVVVVVVAIITVIIYLIDLGLVSGIGGLKNLAQDVVTEVSTTIANAQETTTLIG